MLGDLLRDPGAPRRRVLYLGLKWDLAAPRAYQVHRYVCRPLLGLPAVYRRVYRLLVAATLGQPHAKALPRRVDALLRQAGGPLRRDALVLVEIDQASARRSFDLNLYKSGLPLDAAAEHVLRIGAALEIDPACCDAIMRANADAPLGHLPGGCDADGQPFANVYVEAH